MDNVTKKLLGCGPGGIRCSCCAPPPGTPKRRKLFRIARRKANQIALNEGKREAEEKNEPA